MTLIQMLRFGDDGSLTFDAGCDTGTATIEVRTETMRVTDIALTHVGCSDVVAELTARFMSVLSAGEIQYSLRKGELDLRAGAEVLPFGAQYEGPPPG
jgi:heat shock protein HslJ